jgi:hypothetical protein
MTRVFLLGAALLFAATADASAQSVPDSTPVSAATTQPFVAGGAAGKMSFFPYAWENTLAKLGLSQSDSPAPTRTVDAGNH